MRLAFETLLAGLLIGLLLTWRESSPLTAMLLGGSVLAWSMLSFGSERPD